MVLVGMMAVRAALPGQEHLSTHQDSDQTHIMNRKVLCQAKSDI